MRSFLSPESFSKPPEKAERLSARTPSWLESLAQGLQGLQPERLFKKPEFITWGSERYFGAYDISREAESQQLVTNQLTADLTSFFDEYAFLRASVVYEYDQHGMRNGYTEKVSEIAHNFVERLEQDGKPTERAKLEESVARYVEAWMGSDRVQVGERLMFISPRGSQQELYPGLDERNYVFVNIYEKTETGFLFRQYRSYDPNKQLPVVLKEVAAQTGGGLQRITTDTEVHPDHQTIATAVHIPTGQALERIEQIIYKNKARWRSDIDRDLPNLPEVAAQLQLATVLSFCLSEFTQLAHEPGEHSEKVVAFDLLINTVKKTLLKWVENHALNYDPDKQKDFQIDLEEIRTAWQLEVKKSNGEKLEKEEQAALKKFVASVNLSSTLPLKSAASWAHCITGTPTSLLKFRPTIPRTAVMDIRGGGAAFALLSGEEKSEMLSNLQGYVQVTVNGENWYVPPEYLTGKGCYFDADYGVVMGPCGLPLSEDPFALQAADYYNLLSKLKEDDDLGNLEVLNQADQVRIGHLYQSLLSIIFVPSASFERILFNDIFVADVNLASPLRTLKHELSPSANPIHALLKHLLILQLNNKTEELSELEETILPVATQESFSDVQH
jgi:hypothetical protein